MNTVEPAGQEELAAVLRDADARGLAVIPRGGGTKSEWGNPPARADLVLCTERLNRVVEHAWADLTVTVESGCTVATLQAVLSEHGQRLAVDPLWPERATVGGVLSANDTGALRYSCGGLRDLIIGVTLALPDGTLAVSGGKVVKNVAGYDLPKLATGALGTLGVITRAVFRLHPLPRHSRTLSAPFADLDSARRFLAAVQSSPLALAALQLRTGPEIHADILIEGTQAGIAAQESAVRALAPVDLPEAPPSVWRARQELWNGQGAIARFSVLPSRIADAAASVQGCAVTQATGVGFARVTAGLEALRAKVERMAGSLVILRQGQPRLDAWGAGGDALPLMRALKRQFDPQGTLNPGRFVGGI
jgi:glycolate oxidase FAD binding subunit